MGMKLAPCCHSDGYGVRPSLRNMYYARALKVSSDALKCICDSEGEVSSAIVLNAEASDDAVMSVACRASARKF